MSIKNWVIGFALFSYSASINAQSVGKFIGRISMKKFGLHWKDLPRGLDIAGQNLGTGELDVVLNSESYYDLVDRGIPVNIMIKQAERIDSQYLTKEEILEIVQEAAETHPDIVTVVEIGRSLLNWPIYAVRISSAENADLKPSILFNGMHHAREVMTPEVTTDIIRYLTKEYDNPDKPEVKAWVDNLAIWIIPQVNPDGNTIVWNEDNWWRKNARGDGGGIWGVDINRNYSYHWGHCGGSSSNPSAQDYRGPSAGSEPETQAMMKFVKAQNIAMNISYHSYSEIVISPYGCSGQRIPEKEIVNSVGKALASQLVKDSGSGTYKYGAAHELLYPVDGDDISWMHNEVGTLAYVVEVNSSSQGFQPSYSKWRDLTLERMRKGWQFMLNRLLWGPQVRGQITDAVTGKAVDAEIKIEGLPYTDEKLRRGKRGYFQKVLTSGSHEITFKAAGYQSQTIAVAVENEPVELNVSLEPASDFWDWGF